MGDALGGISCGIILGRRLGRTTGLKILFGVIFAAVCGAVSIALATFGCLASGYNLNITDSRRKKRVGARSAPRWSAAMSSSTNRSRSQVLRLVCDTAALLAN